MTEKSATWKAFGSWWNRSWTEVLQFFGILAIWGILYLPALRTVPGWYGDETLTFTVSRDLFKGIPSNFALWNTFWHPHYPYQQLYSWFCGLAASLGGGDILGGRFFNVLLALAAAMAIWTIGKEPFGRLASLFGALLFLTYYQSIIHFRMCYAHNAVGLGFVGMVLCLLRGNTFRWNLAAGCFLAIAAGSHPLFIYGVLAAFLSRLTKPRFWGALFLPSLLVVGSSLLISWWRFGPWLLEDIHHLEETFSSRGDTDGGGFKGLFNLMRFMTQDWFHIGAIFGIILAFNRRYYPLALTALISLFFLTKNRANLTIFYYQAVIILPTLALCWGRIFTVAKNLPQKSYQKIFYKSLWLIPLASLMQNTIKLAEGKMMPLNQYWVTQSPAEVESAAAWLNEHTTSSDTVGGNFNIGWLLKAHTVPYLQMITWYGYPTQGFENGNKRERFRFDASLEHAKYAVIGDIDRRWAFGEPNVILIANKIRDEQWPLVWSGPNYLIFENPRYQKGK